MDESLTFGEYVRRLRRAKHWQAQELAMNAGLSETHVSRIENDSAMPNSATVVKLAKALDGDLDLMLKLSDCLPSEILDRLVQNTDVAQAGLQRAAGKKSDPAFARALVEDVDPALRSALAQVVGVAEDDVDSIVALLRDMARMTGAQREAISELVKTLVREKGA